jgi:transcriptional regulator with XRE-family HTH domain
MEADLCLDRLAGRLRQWRSEGRLTLQQLAKRSGVAASTIHKIEVRKAVPTVAVLCRIAQGLDRPVTDFLDQEPEPAAFVQRLKAPMTELEPGVQMTTLGDPRWRPSGVRLQISPGHGATFLRVPASELLLLCEDGAVELSRGEARWRLETGDLLTLRAHAPSRLGLACVRRSPLASTAVPVVSTW